MSHNLVPKVVVQRVERKFGCGRYLYVKEGDGFAVSHEDGVINTIGALLPTTDYCVEYRLDPDGVYQAERRVIVNTLTDEYCGVCFLPPEWAGKRVSRREITYDISDCPDKTEAEGRETS